MREQQRTSSSSSRQEINNKLTISLLPPTREHKREEILDRVYFSLSLSVSVLEEEKKKEKLSKL